MTAYDDLCQSLTASLASLRWFAVPEAIKLARYVPVVCEQYKNNSGDAEAQARLRRLADLIYKFCRSNPSPTSTQTAESVSAALTRIQLET
jgi:hypothetical protein